MKHIFATLVALCLFIRPAVASAQSTLPAPQATLSPGTYGLNEDVALTAQSGATIRYTVDGSTPGPTSDVYSAPITLTESLTIRAIALQSGWTTSAVATFAYVVDSTPPTIVATYSPATNPSGWNRTPVTVTFSCTDDSGIANCPQPIVQSQDVTEYVVPVSAEDSVGNVTPLQVTIKVDSVAPTLTLTDPTSPVSTSDAALDVIAVASDARSGIEHSRCSGQEADLDGTELTCAVDLSPGRNSVVVTVSDAAGNVTSRSVLVNRTTAVTSLSISPLTAALSGGESRQLTLSDDSGAPVSGAVWSSTDSGVVSADSTVAGLIHAEGLGTTTVTATLNTLVAEATVTVLPNALVPGTVVWGTAPPALGAYTSGLIKATPVNDDTDADLFQIESTGLYSPSTITAVRAADGAPLWKETITLADAPKADYNGGLVAKLETSAGAVLRRIGGGDIAPWEYLVPDGTIYSYAPAPDGTIFVTEARGTTPSPSNDARSVGYVVGLNGTTGAVTFRTPLPQSTARWPETNPDFTSSCPGYYHDVAAEQGLIGPLAVTESGDALFQHIEAHWNWTTQCVWGQGLSTGTATLRQYRATPQGALTAVTLETHQRSESDERNAFIQGAWGPFTPWASGSDGLGGSLATWQRVTSIEPWETEDRVARILSSNVVFNELSLTGGMLPLVSSEGKAYAAEAPSYQMVARDTATWDLEWSFSEGLFSMPMQALNDGGARLVSWDENFVASLVTTDATGTLVTTQELGDSWPAMAVLRDQGVMHGIGSNGDLQMVAVDDSPVAASFEFIEGSFFRCTPAPLNVNIQSQPPLQIGLVQSATPYSYDFEGTQWTDAQKLGVTEAIAKWVAVAQAAGVQYSFRPFTTQEHTAAAAADENDPEDAHLFAAIRIQKAAFALIDGNPVGGSYTAPTISPTNRRTIKGVMKFNISTNVLESQRGYMKAALHEFGHVFGLAHPSVQLPGGSVMNRIRRIPSTGEFKDDAGGGIATKPTNCDIGGFKSAAAQ